MMVASPWSLRGVKRIRGSPIRLFLLKQSDGLYAAPGSGSAPFDGRLVIADSVHVSDSRRNLLDRFKERGELILAARAPQSALEKIADGSPAYVCYKIECKKRNASEDPSTSKRKKRNARRRDV